MDRVVKNLAVILVGAAASVLTAALLFLMGLRADQSILDMTAATYIPLGAIGAGFIAALGYYVAARMLRIRPGMILLAGVFAISAGTHLYVTHLTSGVLMASHRQTLQEPMIFAKFAATSLVHTRLPDMTLGSGSSSDGSSDSASTEPETEGPHIDTQGSSDAEGMAQGVGGMLAKADVGTQLGAGSTGKLTKLGSGIDSIGHTAEDNSGALMTAVLQILGYALGGVVVYAMLRTLPYCPACGVFMSDKGMQTRYFLSERSLRSSVDDFHEKMKMHLLTDSIMAHFGVGSNEKSHLSEFASTIEIRECKQCHTHRLNFTARRKKGQNWQNIKVLGYAAESIEPIDIVRV